MSGSYASRLARFQLKRPRSIEVRRCPDATVAQAYQRAFLEERERVMKLREYLTARCRKKAREAGKRPERLVRAAEAGRRA